MLPIAAMSYRKGSLRTVLRMLLLELIIRRIRVTRVANHRRPLNGALRFLAFDDECACSSTYNVPDFACVADWADHFSPPISVRIAERSDSMRSISDSSSFTCLSYNSRSKVTCARRLSSFAISRRSLSPGHSLLFALIPLVSFPQASLLPRG